MSKFCVWEDCDQEASYCYGHAHELVSPLGLKYAPAAIEVVDGVISDKSQDADWLRARYFEQANEIERLTELLKDREILRAFFEAFCDENWNVVNSIRAALSPSEGEE